MQGVIDASLAVAGWALTIARARLFMRKWQDKRVAASWLTILFFALATTFQIDAIYFATDRLIGVNNLSWLLAYLFITVAIYAFFANSCIVAGTQQSGWVLPYTVSTFIVLLATFPFGVATSPEWADHNIPRNSLEFVFMNALYLYGSIMFAVAAQALGPLQQQKDSPPISFRIYTVRTITALCAVFFATKLLVSSIGFLAPNWPINGIITFSRIMMAGVGLSLPFMLAHNRAYLTLGKPLLFCRKVQALRALKTLQTRLHHLCPQVPPVQARWWEQIQAVDLYLYRTVIAILDGKRILDAQLKGDAFGQGNQAKEALRLYHSFECIRQNEGFDSLLAALTRINQQLEEGTL